jgi:hypothetical protein
LGALAFVLTAILSGSPAQARVGDGVVAASVDQSPADVRDYWTAARMRGAVPLDAAPPSAAPGAARAAAPRSGPAIRVPGAPPGVGADPRIVRGTIASASGRAASGSGIGPYDVFEEPDTKSYPNRTHGRVFGTFAGIGAFSCSATSVPGNTRSTVITAAHCLFDRGSGFARHWLFVPGYRRGERPSGTWAARRLVVANAYARDDERVTLDVGAALMSADESGRRLADAVGTRGIGFGQPRDQQISAFGYPADPPPFDGELLWVCRGPYAGDDGATRFLGGPVTMRIGCTMGSGASGGGWVIAWEGSSGYVYSVTGYGYVGEPEALYGPYFGSAARRVWIGAQDNCEGRLPTVTGTSGPDEIAGTAGRDVILAGGGDDLIDGGAGHDVICGEAGRDLLEGGGGRDLAYGQSGGDAILGGGGRDRMDGGGGFDGCNGGSGRDSARGCELLRRVP